VTVDLTAVDRNTVSEEIIKQVIGQINSGKLPPGSKLPSERELMEMFHVSRSSVREALHSLAMIGLVETLPGSGSFVSKELANIIGGQVDWLVLLGKQDLLELREVREPLEIQAAGLAAQRATPETVGLVRQAIETFIANLSQEENIMEAEFGVHLTIARVSGNQTLIRIIQIFQNLLADYRRNRLIGFSTSSSSVQEYWDILKAIEMGDVEGAQAGMLRHLNSSKQEALVEQINTAAEPA
jgi:GntR family transcriptional repressor for pyruvate dehydrogenase complex